MAITVHASGRPACTSIAYPNIATRIRPSAHQVTGRCEKPTNAPMSRDRAGAAGEADADGEELEDDEREADDEQQVRDRRAGERVDRLADEVELAEPDHLVRLAAAVLALADDLRGRELRPGRPRSGPSCRRG